jgi:hypothetical protein
MAVLGDGVNRAALPPWAGADKTGRLGSDVAVRLKTLSRDIIHLLERCRRYNNNGLRSIPIFKLLINNIPDRPFFEESGKTRDLSSHNVEAFVCFHRRTGSFFGSSTSVGRRIRRLRFVVAIARSPKPIFPVC